MVPFSSVPPTKPQTTPTGWGWVRGDHPRRRIERRELMKTPPRCPSVEPRDFVIAGRGWVRGRANWGRSKGEKQDGKRGRGKDSMIGRVEEEEEDRGI